MNKLTKKTFKNTVIGICLLSYTLTGTAAFAGNAANFKILQEVLCKDGIMVAHPKPQDEVIYKLLLDNNINNPKDYAKWLSENIVYKQDGQIDSWSRPLELLQKRYGDCEDFTLLNIAVLRFMGYKPLFLAFYFKGVPEGHAICVFKHGQHFYYFNNMELRLIKEPNLLEFAKNMSISNKYSAIKELDLETRKWNLIYKNI